MTKAQYNVILSLFFIVIAKQYTGNRMAWVFFILALVFFIKAIAAYGKAYRDSNFVRRDIDSVPPTV